MRSWGHFKDLRVFGHCHLKCVPEYSNNFILFFKNYFDISILK
jgi:hypothetical protein